MNKAESKDALIDAMRENDALRAEVAELTNRLECLHSILGGGQRSPEQAARETVAEVARLQRIERAAMAHDADFKATGVGLSNAGGAILSGIGPDGKEVE
jgi:hypothetical protein